MTVAAIGGVAAALEVLIAQEVSNQVIGQLVAALVQAVVGPELEFVGEASEQAFVMGGGTRALDSASIIDAYIKGHLDKEKAIKEIQFSGQNEDHFNILQQSAGESPAFQILFEAWRRGIIEETVGETSLEQGIKESRLKNKWIPKLKQMQFRLADPGVLIEGWLRSVIEEVTAREELYKNGIDEKTATMMYKAAGRPISPTEAWMAFHRGLIEKEGRGADLLTMEQAFLESDIKNKWWPVWAALQEYLPPPRTITALLRAGSITEAEARDLFHKSGLNEHLAQVYVANASHQKTQAVKELAVGTVVNMYKAKELARQQAEDFITKRGYTKEDADFLLDYADFQLVEAQVGALVTRLRTYYVGHKIQKQTVIDALHNVGMAAESISHLLAIWDQEAHASPALLTATQLATAAGKGVIDPLAAYDEIQGRGYDARDAWVLLAEHKADMTGVPKPAGILTSA